MPGSSEPTRHDRRWFEQALPERLQSSDEYDQVAGAWARARRSSSPYHGEAFRERADRLHALMREYESEVLRRSDAAGSGER